MNLVKTTFITYNKIGKIGRITKEIYDRGFNITKSRMITYKNLLILNTEHNSERGIKIDDIVLKYNIKDLNDIFKISEGPGFNVINKKLRIECADSPGIIHDTSFIMSDLGINIVSLKSDTDLSPMSSINLFKLSMDLNVPHKLDIDQINNRMEKINFKYGIDYVLK
jgi:glycine cleavage system regulatory protein